MLYWESTCRGMLVARHSTDQLCLPPQRAGIMLHIHECSITTTHYQSNQCNTTNSVHTYLWINLDLRGWIRHFTWYLMMLLPSSFYPRFPTTYPSIHSVVFSKAFLSIFAHPRFTRPTRLSVMHSNSSNSPTVYTARFIQQSASDNFSCYTVASEIVSNFYINKNKIIHCGQNYLVSNFIIIKFTTNSKIVKKYIYI